MLALVISGAALTLAGVILCFAALRRREERHYRWLVPRSAPPPGVAPLPRGRVPWDNSAPAIDELVQIERAGKRAGVLPSRFSRVVPSLEPAPVPAETVAPEERTDDARTSEFEQALDSLLEQVRSYAE